MIYELLVIPAAIIALVLHEVAHGYAAYKLGDPTAHIMGRLSLNPLKHIDPIGALCMVFFHFGWAKPVPINTRYFDNPKRDMALTALAGPLTNFIISFLSLPFYILAVKFYNTTLLSGGSAFLLVIAEILLYFFMCLHSVNLGLGLFNLIPIPPLDGSRVLFAFLPEYYYFRIMRYERYISFALMLLLFCGFRFGILSTVSAAISNAMLRVWMLIPIF